MDFPVKVKYTVNGAIFFCKNQEQLDNFLSSGWVIVQKKKTSAKKKKEE